MKRILRIILGVALIIVGVALLVTPLTPGSWLALIGLELLGVRLLIQRTLLSFLPTRMRIRANAWLNRLAENRWFKRLRPKSKTEEQEPPPSP